MSSKPEPDLAVLDRILRNFTHLEGCMSNCCVFGHEPGTVGTNGGCGCFKGIDNKVVRQLVQSIIVNLKIKDRLKVLRNVTG